jgi:hypothetical protein
MVDELPRSRQARLAAEQALVRVVHHYGSKPEFVVLGGLVPELLCSSSTRQHAGTTDIDVQVNLEIECGAVNTERLERALKNAEFEPDNERVWRWRFVSDEIRAVVKFELLADRDDKPFDATFSFDNCEYLGAANLRGTKYAAEDIEVRTLNDLGGPAAAANTVIEKFGAVLGASETALHDLAANFADPNAQGPKAYANQILVEHPDIGREMAKADAMTSVAEFHDVLAKYM